jgi:hypothetical protein
MKITERWPTSVHVALPQLAAAQAGLNAHPEDTRYPHDEVRPGKSSSGYVAPHEIYVSVRSLEFQALTVDGTAKG